MGEKAKAKAAADAADMAQQLDQAQIMNSAMEKKAKQFDRIVGEWKAKVDGLGMDLDTAQKETRNISSELFRVKNAYDEAVIQLEEVRRENKLLSNEIKDTMDQISEGGHSIHEIDKIRKRLEAEKMELEAALSEAEGALEQEENKVLRASLELTWVKQEIERRIAQKEEEFASTRKNFGKAIEGMQMALEAETKGKVEALRMKKKLDSDVVDLGVALEHANAANAESQRNISLIQGNIRNVQKRFEEVREAHQGADLPAGRGQEEPREDAGSHRPAAGQDQVLQETDRGGGGDRRPQPGQVQAGADQPDRQHRARRPQRAGLGQDARQGS